MDIKQRLDSTDSNCTVGVDCDGDTIMSPQLPTNEMNDDSSDDEKLLVMLENAKKRNQRFKHALQKKMPSENCTLPNNIPKTSGASTSSGGSSVFGTSVRLETKQTDRQMAAIMRERVRRQALERENAELRAELEEASKHKGKATSQEEKMFANMARVEIRHAGETLRTFDKYHSAIALFLAPPAWPRAVKHLWDSDDLDLHPLHDSLLKAHRSGMPLNARFIFLMRQWCERRDAPPQYVGRMLFFRLVYDPTDGGNTHSRRHELSALLIFIQYACTKGSDGRRQLAKLSPMQQVLRNFGALLSYKAVAFDAAEKAPKKCLDRRITYVGKQMNDELIRAMRNLGRAFKIWAELVRLDSDLSGVLGEEREQTQGLSETAVYCHDIAMICIRVLMSPFGSRLGDEIGELLTAVFDTINKEEWSGFRSFFALSVVSFTTRLGLLADLVTYLMPFESDRARALGLDIAYMTMWRWHTGPPECPKIAQIRELPLSDDAEAEISFVLEDVVQCIEEIPELVPKSDVVWAQLIARMMKFVVLEHSVLETRQKGQLGRIYSAVKRITKFVHRLPFGVPRSSLKYTIDTLITAMRGFVGSSSNDELALDAR